MTYTFGHDEISQTTVPYSSDPNPQPLTPSTLFFAHDGHGSVRVLLDAAGAIATVASPATAVAVRQLFTYDAYGNAIGFNMSAAATVLLYSGEQFDQHAMMQYLRARFYDGTNGRFVGLDPFFGNLQDPQSLHKYLYTHGNPIAGVDPSGQFLETMLVALNIAFVSFQDAAPKIATYAFAVANIAFYATIAGMALHVAEFYGLVPESPVDDIIILVATTTFALATATQQGMQVVPLPSGKVPWGSTELGRNVQAQRRAFANTMTGGSARFGVKTASDGRQTTPNALGVRFRDRSDGKIKTRVYFSGKEKDYTSTHTERKMDEDFQREGILPEDVYEIHSELQPCRIPAPPAGCDAMLRARYPNVRVTWNFDYGDTQESRRNGMQSLSDRVSRLTSGNMQNVD